jgi:hypothetical protein
VHVLALWVALAAAPSLTDTRTAEKDIEHARALIEQLEEEQALKILTKYQIDTALPPALRGRACIYAGIAFINLAHDAEAHRSFRDALRADPGASVPAWVSRKVRAEFDSALAEHQSEEHLKTVLTTPPPTVEKTSSRAPVIFAGTGAALVLVSIASFIVWQNHRFNAISDPVALSSAQKAQKANVFWYTGLATAGAGLTLAGTGTFLWLKDR